ncbi:phage tail sheath C-terminal domain-containing protein [Paenibacillus sp. FSL R5-0908]|uniref:phage tail sheath C-terminal domain-containing protein n=1 Tax=Paenibacillus sp. FSL R5-0908 TaxID=2921664 RepID=UPI0030F8AAE7
MAGSYQEGQSQVLSGVYSLIKAVLSSVSGSTRGVLAVPFTATWGPVNKLQTLGRATEFDTQYGTKEGLNGIGSATSAQKIRALAFKATPSQVLGYRMATSSAAPGSATLATGWTLQTVYPSDRAFVATVKAGVANGSTAVQITEAGVLLLAVEDTTVAGLTAKINASGIVKVTAAGAALPTNVASVAFTGGNNGATVTATEYGAFLAEVEADHTANGIALDGTTDSAILAVLSTWVRRVRDEGLYITAVQGGPTAWDSSLTTANAASLVLNYRGIINVGNGVDGYTAGEAAVYVASLVCSTALNAGITDLVTPFTEVNVKSQLTRGNRIAAKNSGTLLFTMEGGQVLIDEGVNTLTSPVGDEVAPMGKIRVNNVLDYITGSLEAFGNKYKQSKSNTQTARQTYAATVEDTFFSGLARMEAIQPDYSYVENPDYHGENPAQAAKLDEAFFLGTYQPVDSMEKIYNKYLVQF